MGVCIEKIQHTCGGKKSLQVFQEADGSYTGYCFRCSEFVKDPYGEGGQPKVNPNLKIKSPEEIQKELQMVQEYGSHALPERKLTARALEYFGYKVALSESDGVTPVARFIPYYQGDTLKGFKVKLPNKAQYSIGSTRACDMFGWKQAVQYGHKYRLYITEGEEDAVALFRVLKSSWDGSGEPAVVSLRTGASGATREIDAHLKDIQRLFKQVVLVFDNDKPGRDAVQAVSKLLPGVLVAQLPLKDANDMLVAGREKELREAVLFQATAKISASSYRANEIRHLAKETVQRGLDWPWQEMTDVTRGRRRKEVYYFGAGVKMGKSVLVDQIAAHCVQTQDTPVWMCKPEEPLGGTLKRLAGKVMRSVFWDPKVSYEEAALDQGLDAIADKVILYDGYQGVDWDVIRQEIRSAVMVAGVKDVFLDPLTCFTVGMSLTEQNERLIAIASEIASMAMELDFTAYLFCHLNAPSGGVPHERGGKVQSVQFSGSRAMMRFCHQMWGLEGNKDPDLPLLERNRRDLVLLEDRMFGESCRIKLQYDNRTGCLDPIIDMGDPDV